jgi:hypothetical protein
MDIFTLTFYGTVCGLLAYASPTMKNKFIRLTVGIFIGLLAAALLPLIRTTAYF